MPNKLGRERSHTVIMSRRGLARAGKTEGSEAAEFMTCGRAATIRGKPGLQDASHHDLPGAGAAVLPGCHFPAQRAANSRSWLLTFSPIETLVRPGTGSPCSRELATLIMKTGKLWRGRNM